jgi:hypothetical protein
MKIAAFASEIKYFNDQLTGDAHRMAFAQYAAAVRDEEIARQSARGAAPTVRTTVDGVRDAPLTAVKLGGHIRFDFSYFNEQVLFALAVLRGICPKDSGEYRDHFFAMLPNATRIDPRAIPPGTPEVIVTNDMAYSRKIEVGAHGFKLRSHIFEAARQALIARYRNISTADVKFITLPGGYVLRGRQLSGAKRYAAQIAVGSADARGRVLVKTSTGAVIVTRVTRSRKQVYTARKDTMKGEQMTYPALSIRGLG